VQAEQAALSGDANAHSEMAQLKASAGEVAKQLAAAQGEIAEQKKQLKAANKAAASQAKIAAADVARLKRLCTEHEEELEHLSTQISDGAARAAVNGECPIQSVIAPTACPTVFQDPTVPPWQLPPPHSGQSQTPKTYAGVLGARRSIRGHPGFVAGRGAAGQEGAGARGDRDEDEGAGAASVAF
jgi:hypothetical protein